MRDPDRVARAEFAFHRAFNRAGGRLKLSWFLLHAARYLPPQLFASDEAWGPVAVASHDRADRGAAPAGCATPSSS